MTFEEMAAEYRESLVGQRIYRRVREATERLLRKRDPRTYAQGSHDYRDALDDVVNDFILAVLIKERQLDYIFEVATQLEDFDRLVNHHIRRFLARTRLRTVVDNLLDRSIEMLRQPPFVVIAGAPPDESFGLLGTSYTNSVASSAAIREAAALARNVPTDKTHASERAPRVYDSASLSAVLSILLATAGTPVSRETISAFFEQSLTAWYLGTLDSGEQTDTQDPSFNPEEVFLIQDTAEGMIAEMSEEDRIIFAYKHANLPDRQVAQRLGLSRQSTAPRKAALMARLRTALAGLDSAVQAGVLTEVAGRLAREQTGGANDP